jgi:hypothetical protein
MAMKHPASTFCLVGALGLLPACFAGSADAASRPARTELAETVPHDDPAALFDLAHRLDTVMADHRARLRVLDLYCQAARKGHAEAAFSIGLIFFGGRGVPRDVARAAAWFRLAAARGHALSARLARTFIMPASSAASGCPGSHLHEDALHEDELQGTRLQRTGHVARLTEVVAPPEIAALVSALAPEYKLDPDLVLAIISVESAFKSDAISPRRARGLMQLMPETAARFGVIRAFDPLENIRGGMKYLRWLRDYFDGDLALILAAYNAGESAVDRFGGVPPFPETKAYIEKISQIYGAPILPSRMSRVR